MKLMKYYLENNSFHSKKDKNVNIVNFGNWTRYKYCSSTSYDARKDYFGGVNNKKSI